MSTRHDDGPRVDLVLREIGLLASITARSDRPAFAEDPVLQHAAVMALLNVGEIANRLSVSTRELAPDVPWTRIIGLRNVSAHGYATLDMADIWETMATDVPELGSKLQTLRAAL